VTCARDDETKKMNKRNVPNWIFTDTILVIESKSNFCVEVVISFQVLTKSVERFQIYGVEIDLLAIFVTGNLNVKASRLKFGLSLVTLTSRTSTIWHVTVV